MNRVGRLTFALGLFLVCLAGCGPKTSEGTRTASDTQPVVVFAAASTTNAIDEIKSAFAKQNAVEVRSSYAASSALAQQIANGAEADVFISADLKWGDYVEGKTPVSRRRNLLGNRLVIVVPADSPLKLQKPEDLLNDQLKHLALADPAAVPAGKYAKQALSKLGIWEKLQGKVTPGADVRHALAYVETAAAEAGIVYATDARISQKVRVAVEIPANLTEPVRYPVLLLKRAEGNPKAALFYQYLGSPEAKKVFEGYGFEVLAEPVESSRRG